MAQGRKENRLWAERKDAVAIMAGLPANADGLTVISLLFNAPIGTLRAEVATYRARMVAELKAQRAKEDALIAEHDAATTTTTDSKPQADSKPQTTAQPQAKASGAK